MNPIGLNGLLDLLADETQLGLCEIMPNGNVANVFSKCYKYYRLAGHFERIAPDDPIISFTTNQAKINQVKTNQACITISLPFIVRLAVSYIFPISFSR